MQNCQLCGEPMPAGEEMFNFHGHSGPCPKPPTPEPIIDPNTLSKLFGVDRDKIPAVRGLEPVRNDYTSGFEAGVTAAVEWLRALPQIEMPTKTPNVFTVHDMSALEAAGHLEEQVERNRN
jgi:hypothetical protein